MNFAFYLHEQKSQEEFEKSLLWLKARYEFASVADLRAHIYEGRPLKNACVLTADDGLKSTYDVIFPVLKKHGVPLTVFISLRAIQSGENFWFQQIEYCDQEELKRMFVDKGWFEASVLKYPLDMICKEVSTYKVYEVLKEYMAIHPEVSMPRRLMNVAEMREMMESDLVTFGAHTLRHPVLTQIGDEDVAHEICDSVAQLSELLGQPATTFAYPNGMEGDDFGEREMALLRQVGVEMAFSTNPGVIGRGTNSLAIPRWGSLARLRFGRLGMYLPSRMNMAGIRNEIRKFRLEARG